MILRGKKNLDTGLRAMALGAGLLGVSGFNNCALAQQGSTQLDPVVVNPSTARPAVNRRASSAPASAPARRASSRRDMSPPQVAVSPPQGAGETGKGHVDGIVAHRSTTGTKTDSPLLTTPQSISVVTQDQIWTQGARSVAEALRYEAGVVSETRVGDRFDNVFIRGYGGFGGNANYLHFWDGLRLPRGANYAMPSVDPYLLERIEIARGPGSVLYGQNNLGGLVNLISKDPTPVPYHEIFTRFGNNNRIEGGFDFSGPIDPDGKLLYRLIGLGRKADADVNYTTTERYLIAPSITWRPDIDTKLTIRSSYDHDPNSFQPNWLPALATLQKNPNGQIPRDFFSGHPDYNQYDRKQASVGYEFERHLNDSWTVRQNFRYMNVDSDFKALSVTGFGAAGSCGVGTPANLCIQRQITHYIENLDAIALDNQAETRFSTGWLQHKLLVGVDYQKSWANATFNNPSATVSPNINFLNPNYGTITPPALNTQTDQNRQQVGVYSQDEIKWGRLNISLGIRNDWADASTSNVTLASRALSAVAKPSDTAVTWRAGASYELDGGFAPYVSYSTSFEPVLGTDYTGAPFRPTTGEQYEVGLKYQPVGLNALFMASYYDLMQRNVLTIDTANRSNVNCTASAGYCQTQLGGVHSKGVELSAKATLSKGFDLIASYTHVDIVTTEGTAIISTTPRLVTASLQGKVPVGAPSNTAALWLDYTMQGGPLAGFGLGGGVRYIGSSYGDNINTNAMIVPAYTLVDAMLHYDLAGLSPQLRGWKAAVNVTNLFDKYYVSACASSNQCFVGNGRSTMGTLRYQW